MNNKNLETVNKPKLLEKTVLSKYDDGMTTLEICVEGAQLRIDKTPNNDIKLLAYIPHDANKRGLVDRLTSLTQQDIAVAVGVSQPTISRMLNSEN